MDNRFNFKEHFDKNYMNYVYLTLVVLLTLCVRLLANAQVNASIYIFVVFFIFLYVIKKIEHIYELFIYYFFFFLYTLILAYGFYGSFIVTILISIVFSSIYYSIFIFEWHLNNVINNKILSAVLFSLSGVIILIIFEVCRFYFPLVGEYEFFENKFLLQWTSLVGPLGLDFLVLFICQMLANLVLYGYKKMYKFVFVVGLLIVSLTMYSAIRLTTKKDVSHNIKIAMATGPYQGKETIGYFSIAYEDNVACFDEIVSYSTIDGASILVFSEEAFVLDVTKRDEFINHACMNASMYNMNILLACEFDKLNVSGQVLSATNEILFINNNGEVVNNYLKYKTIPFIEDNVKRGDGVLPNVMVNVDGLDIKLSYCICYDSDFSTYITRIDEDVDLFIVPTWDWEGIQNKHYKTVGANSVTHRTTTVKVTYDGYTTITNQYGDLLYKENTNDIGYGKEITYDVPINSSVSLYDIININNQEKR